MLRGKTCQEVDSYIHSRHICVQRQIRLISNNIDCSLVEIETISRDLIMSIGQCSHCSDESFRKVGLGEASPIAACGCPPVHRYTVI